MMTMKQQHPWRINRLPPAWVWHFMLFLLLIALLLVCFPDSPRLERDLDEGSHLMMAWLYHQGFSFYDQIYTDHFRMFNVLLSGWMDLFGFTIPVARAMVAMMSALLLWLLYWLLLVRSGVVAALAGVAMVLVSGAFLLHAGAIMQALPWILFGLASLAALRLAERIHNSLFFYLSAGLMALAIQTKMFALLMLPAMAWELLRHGEAQGGEGRSMRAGILLRWGMTLLAASLLLLAVTAPALFDLTHLDAHTSYLFASHLGLEGLLPSKTLGRLLWSHAGDFPMVLLAVVGMVLVLRRGASPDWFPLLWLIANLAALGVMHPIWRQYYTLISIPVIWLAAQAIAEFQCAGSVSVKPLDGWLRQGVTVMLWLLLISFPMRIDGAIHGMSQYDSTLNSRLIAELRRLAPETNWMVTDRPIYPFLAHINVVPELAVTSSTLIYSGIQQDHTYVQAIDHYHPKLVLLGRFRHLRRTLKAALAQRGYVRVFKGRDSWLYVRRDTARPDFNP
ncbi:MAG: hypothetical protein Q9M26_04685 [Mariprofundales bacterium]|nr:hypothetical protein [Mariprofundales bacterium]